MSRPFAEGDLVLLIDARGRRTVRTLGRGRFVDTHHGRFAHEEIIGKPEGCRLRTHMGHRILALRPTLADYVMHMPRKSNIIYPKETGPVLVHGDIYPGARVLEAGIGSGALTLALLRAVGPTGQVISCEVREDMAAFAVKNIRGFLGEPPNHTLRIADLSAGVQERDLDRVVLDLPEPWRALNAVAEAMRLGGILISYLPTVLQIHKLHGALAADPRWELAESFEVLHRSWHLSETSARPDHRMVGHTGFLTRAVLCEPREGGPPAPSQEAAEEGPSALQGDERPEAD